MTPGAWGPGSELRCARCGRHPLYDATRTADGYVCRGCVTPADLDPEAEEPAPWEA